MFLTGFILGMLFLFFFPVQANELINTVLNLTSISTDWLTEAKTAISEKFSTGGQ